MFEVGGGLDPFNVVADSLDGVDEGANVTAIFLLEIAQVLLWNWEHTKRCRGGGP